MSGKFHHFEGMNASMQFLICEIVLRNGKISFERSPGNLQYNATGLLPTKQNEMIAFRTKLLFDGMDIHLS